MAAIERYVQSSGETRYRVRYRTPERRQTDKRGFRTKRDAEAFAASVEAAKLHGEYISDSAGAVTVGELYADWAAGRARIKSSTRAKEDSAWRVHVKQRWGSTAVGTIRTSSIRSWIADLAESGSQAATIETALRVLRGVLDLAVEDRRIQRNPCVGVKPPRRGHSRRGYLTHEQVAALAIEISTQRVTYRGGHAEDLPRPTFGVIVRLLAYTGLRWGEMAALRVADVNLRRRRLDVRRAVAEVRGELVYSTPKSHERRSVPYPAFLDDDMADLVKGKRGDDLIFTGPKGAPLRVSDFRPRHFLPAVARCQAADPIFPTISPHGLRHSAASLAISAGANVKAVQTMLGHKSAAMTLDTYADLFPDDLDNIAAALHRAASRVPSAGTTRRAQHERDTLTR